MRASYIHPSSAVDEGSIIAAGVYIWHFCHLMPGCEIGENSNLGQNVFVDRNVVVGKRVKIQNNVSLYEGVTIEDDVFLGPSMVFTNVINPRSFLNRKAEFKKTVVRKGATIGANATIICGVEIGEYALIGAGSVVTKDVLPFALVTGNPSKQIGWVSVAGLPLHFLKNNLVTTCPQMGDKYKLLENKVVRLSPEDMGL